MWLRLQVKQLLGLLQQVGSHGGWDEGRGALEGTAGGWGDHEVMARGHQSLQLLRAPVCVSGMLQHSLTMLQVRRLCFLCFQQIGLSP